MDTLSIKNGTRGSLPRVPFLAIKEKILGKKYALSLMFVGDTRMRTVNHAYRKKDMTTDILSFPFDSTSGEIIISPKEAAKRSKRFDMNARDYTAFLFIHGCLHLTGMEHGSKMEHLENKWCTYFKLPKPHID